MNLDELVSGIYASEAAKVARPPPDDDIFEILATSGTVLPSQPGLTQDPYPSSPSSVTSLRSVTPRSGSQGRRRPTAGLVSEQLLRAGTLPAKQLLGSTHSLPTRTPSASASFANLGEDSGVFGGQLDPATEPTRRAFFLMNFLKQNRPDLFYVQVQSAPLAAFAPTKARPYDGNIGNGTLVLRIDFPMPLKRCRFDMVYLGVFSLFDGLLDSESTEIETPSEADVETFCLAISGFILKYTQNYNQYVKVFPGIDRVRASSSITLTFSRVADIYKRELKLRSLSRTPTTMEAHRLNLDQAGLSAVSNVSVGTRRSAEVELHCSRLHSLDAKRRSQQALAVRERDELELSQCTFQPEINERSRALSSQRSTSVGTGGKSSCPWSLEEDIRAHTAKHRSYRALETSQIIMNEYLFELQQYVQNSGYGALFPDAHPIWDDAYQALRQASSRRQRDQLLDDFKEVVAREARLCRPTPVAGPAKLSYLPHESILDPGAQSNSQMCFHAARQRETRPGEPYSMDPRRRRNTALARAGKLPEKYIGMTDETFAALPVGSTLHMNLDERQEEYRQRSDRAERRAAIAKAYRRGGGDVTCLLDEPGSSSTASSTAPIDNTLNACLSFIRSLA
ncbi:hypothetical protein GMRT_11678 [Giardia muris]|uniref:Uncharacterized protein n=1 Tax=Giardia muris TaxID=5742 RepID=A0A4Z1T8R9_GIAMU|nr:hypothetical protein GMRT_11678 [Giardia muris]|eukprot:TNJ29527.1 hypothetical protein GMRT_11678 [Giardia muris]